MLVALAFDAGALQALWEQRAGLRTTLFSFRVSPAESRKAVRKTEGQIIQRRGSGWDKPVL